MSTIKHVISNCPPYLLFLSFFSMTVAFGLFKLYGALQSVGL